MPSSSIGTSIQNPKEIFFISFQATSEIISSSTHIEQDLLRAAVAVITRNNAGKSNWQSWHNAAIGAVGFALNDRALIDRALDDPKNGFRFQMRESVMPDGAWYEGAWGYHFFALDPHLYLAEAAYHFLKERLEPQETLPRLPPTPGDLLQ